MGSLADILSNGGLDLSWNRPKYPTPDFTQPDMRKALMDILPLKLKAADMPLDAEHVGALSFHAREDLTGAKKVHIRCKGKTIVDENEVDSLVRHLVEKNQWDKGMKKPKPLTGFAAFAANDKPISILGPNEPDDPFEGHYTDNAPTLPRFDGNYERLCYEFVREVNLKSDRTYGISCATCIDGKARSMWHKDFWIVRDVATLDICVYLGEPKRNEANRPLLGVEDVRAFCNNRGVDMPLLYSAMIDLWHPNTKDDRATAIPVDTGEVVVTIKKKKRRLG